MKIKMNGVTNLPKVNTMEILADYNSGSSRFQKSHGAWACSISGKEHFNCTRYKTDATYTQLERNKKTNTWRSISMEEAEFFYPTFLDYVKNFPQDKYFYPGRTHRIKEALYLSFEKPQSKEDILNRCKELEIVSPTYIVTEFETQVVWILEHYYILNNPSARRACIRTQKLLEIFFPEAKVKNTYSRLINPYIYGAQWIGPTTPKYSNIYETLSYRYRKQYGKEFSGFNETNHHDSVYNTCIKHVYKMSWEVSQGLKLWPEKDFKAWYEETFPELVGDPEYEDIPPEVYSHCRKNFNPGHIQNDKVKMCYRGKRALLRYEYKDILEDETLSDKEKMERLNIGKKVYERLNDLFPTREAAKETIQEYFQNISPHNTVSLPKYMKMFLKLRESNPELQDIDISRVYPSEQLEYYMNELDEES